jgi:hypothetical protein
MEQARYDHRSGILRERYPQSAPFSIPPKIEKRIRDQLLFDEAVCLSGDWLEATDGQSISQNQFDDLHRAGFVSHGSQEILEIFYDWEDYQQVSATFYKDKLEEKVQKEQELLDAIKLECGAGLLPEIFLKEAIPYAIRYCKVNSITGERGKVKRQQRFELTEYPAKPKKVIERYYKYQLIDRLSQDSPSDEPMPEGRKIGIAMGFNVASGIALASYNGSLKQSHKLLSDVDIERACEELGCYDYVYRQARDKHLNDLLRSAAAEHYDIKRRRLVGKTAVVDYMRGKEKPEGIRLLSDLLLGSDFGELGIKKEKRRVSKASREDVIKYGEWLLSIVENATGRRTMNEDVLRRASMLGLGPSPDQIVHPTRFSSSSEFYSALNLTDAKIVKRFHNYKMEDFAELLEELSALLGKILIFLVRISSKIEDIICAACWRLSVGRIFTSGAL